MGQKRSFYIYLDESGNLDFSSNGTRHFVLCALLTNDPVTSQLALLRLKHSMLEAGVDTSYFHASEDIQTTRNQVFKSLLNLGSTRLIAVAIDKRYHANKLTGRADFYANCSRQLLELVIKHQMAKLRVCQNLIVVFDNALRRTDQGVIEQAIKPLLKSLGIPYYIYFHRTLTDFNGQIADYGAWSAFVKYERNELRPSQAINKMLDIVKIK